MPVDRSIPAEQPAPFAPPALPGFNATTEQSANRHEILLRELKDAVAGRSRRVVNCVALGQNLFARYWECRPEGPRRQADIFRAYRLPEMAPAYFVHNIFEALCAESVLSNNHIWYPAQGKEAYQLGEVAMKGR